MYHGVGCSVHTLRDGFDGIRACTPLAVIVQLLYDGKNVFLSCLLVLLPPHWFDFGRLALVFPGLAFWWSEVLQRC